MKKRFGVLWMAALLSACGTGGGGNGGGGGGGGGGNPTGDVPPELVGVWQDTKASSGEYTNITTGVTFTLTQGYSVQLKIAPNGQFYFAHFSKGVSRTCAAVSYFDQMTGVAVFQNNQLTLTPTQRRLDITNCADSGSRTLGNTPLSFDVTLSETPSEIGEPSYRLALAGSEYTLDLRVLQREPPSNPDQPPQPQGFQLGTEAMFQELVGLWAPSAGSSTDFYNPQTGSFNVPALNGSEHRWLRFTPDGYEMAKVFINANIEGVCKKDLVYYEKGKALFNLLEDVGNQGQRFIGDLRLEATDAHMVVSIRECDSDNGVKRYTLKPLTGYFRWAYDRRAPETFDLGCQYSPWNRWQFGACTNRGSDWNGFIRRQ